MKKFLIGIGLLMLGCSTITPEKLMAESSPKNYYVVSAPVSRGKFAAEVQTMIDAGWTIAGDISCRDSWCNQALTKGI